MTIPATAGRKMRVEEVRWLVHSNVSGKQWQKKTQEDDQAYL